MNNNTFHPNLPRSVIYGPLVQKRNHASTILSVSYFCSNFKKHPKDPNSYFHATDFLAKTDFKDLQGGGFREEIPPPGNFENLRNFKKINLWVDAKLVIYPQAHTFLARDIAYIPISSEISEKC